MHGSRRSNRVSGISALLKIAEWILYYFVLTRQEKQDLWLTFKTKYRNLRTFYDEPNRNFFFHLWMRASLLAIMIYYQLPAHPLTLPIAIGGGLSAVLILRSIDVMVHRYVAR